MCVREKRDPGSESSAAVERWTADASLWVSLSFLQNKPCLLLSSAIPRNRPAVSTAASQQPETEEQHQVFPNMTKCPGKITPNSFNVTKAESETTRLKCSSSSNDWPVDLCLILTSECLPEVSTGTWNQFVQKVISWIDWLLSISGE